MDLAMDPVSGVSLADYTWLPTDLQQAFQATLEKDDGIAIVHFIAQIEKMSRNQYQKRVLAASSQALYICTHYADISRCIYINRIEQMFVCDEWICLTVPGEYDICLRFTAENASSTCNQNFFISVLNGLRKQLHCPVLVPVTVSSLHALSTRSLDRPMNYVDVKPVAIPVLSWEALSNTVPRADVLIRSLLPHHAMQCARYEAHHSPQRQESHRSRNEESLINSMPSPPHKSITKASGIHSPQPVAIATSPIRRQNGGARQTHSPPRNDPSRNRFIDPCLELVWEELMAQRKAIEEMRAQIGMLLQEKFPHSDPGRMEKDPPRYNVKPHVEPRVAGLEDLTPFQRELVKRHIHQEPVHREFMSPGYKRASPENWHPSDPQFVRRFASPQQKTAAGGRSTVAANDFLQSEDAPHYQTATKASRHHQVGSYQERRVRQAKTGRATTPHGSFGSPPNVGSMADRGAWLAPKR